MHMLKTEGRYGGGGGGIILTHGIKWSVEKEGGGKRKGESLHIR